MNFDRGFTLIELIIAMAIVLILAAIGISNFGQYREHGFQATSDSLMHDAQVALETGAAAMSNAAPDFYWAWTDADGIITGWRVDEFAPGLRASPDIRVDIGYDAWCANNFWCAPDTMCCIAWWATTRHCDGEFATQVLRWNNGTMVKSQWPNWGC